MSKEDRQANLENSSRFAARLHLFSLLFEVFLLFYGLEDIYENCGVKKKNSYVLIWIMQCIVYLHLCLSSDICDCLHCYINLVIGIVG